MLDPATLAAYASGADPGARAQAVRDSLGSGTLTVELRDGETLIYSGTFTGPMTAGGDGSLSADVLLSGLVGTAGTPSASTWMCRIRNADGRYVEGSFGPGGRFTWSGGALVVGQAVRLRVSIAAAGASSALPFWARGAPLQEWIEIPNTALSSVPPTWSGPGTRPPGITGPSSKIGSWNGASLQRVGSVYRVGPGGGHADYYGNEINKLDLSVDSPQWVEEKPCSAYADILDSAVVYLDGARSSCHTYWSQQFDQVNGRVFVVSSGVPFGGGMPEPPAEYAYPTGTPILQAFDVGTNAWLAPTTFPNFPFGATQSADLVCANPVTNEFFINSSQKGALWKFNPTVGWTNVGSWYLNGAYAGSAIDPTRDRMLVVGNFGGTRDPFVRSTLDASAVSVTFGGLGAAALRMDGYPSVVYDEDNDQFLVFKNSEPITVYAVDAADFTVSILATTGTSPAKRPGGIQNSAQYVPELHGVVMANSYTGNVKFMRVA